MALRALVSFGVFLLACVSAASAPAQTLRLPTANRAIYEPGGEPRYFVGTVGKTWVSGTFGCVRSGGWQMHEGLDIRSVQRDKKGEPVDPVMATADGTVVYINKKSGLSNYGNYLILRHRIDGFELYSLYAHLRQVDDGLQVGSSVVAGQTVGILGRTSNTRQRISLDRAHVHFELNLMINEKFASWQKTASPGQRNDHGNWNGQNLLGLDPRQIFLEQQAQGSKFSLLKHVQSQKELCRVFVKKSDFPWLRRYPQLMMRNPLVDKQGLSGYELALNFNGIPFQIIPRAPSEITTTSKAKLLSVNAAEQTKNPARRLITKKNERWELATHGLNLLDLLTY